MAHRVGSHVRKGLGLRAYSRHRGVTLRAVQKAVAAGRISAPVDDLGRYRIDPVKADQEWSESTHPRFDNSPEAEAYRQARNRRIYFQAKLLELEVIRRSSELVSAELVRRAQQKIYEEISKALRAFPQRIALALGVEPDDGRVASILEPEIERIIENLRLGFGIPLDV